MVNYSRRIGGTCIDCEFDVSEVPVIYTGGRTSVRDIINTDKRGIISVFFALYINAVNRRHSGIKQYAACHYRAFIQSLVDNDVIQGRFTVCCCRCRQSILNLLCPFTFVTDI